MRLLGRGRAPPQRSGAPQRSGPGRRSGLSGGGPCPAERAGAGAAGYPSSASWL
jgi:hypothetical protein